MVEGWKQDAFWKQDDMLDSISKRNVFQFEQKECEARPCSIFLVIIWNDLKSKGPVIQFLPQKQLKYYHYRKKIPKQLS